MSTNEYSSTYDARKPVFQQHKVLVPRVNDEYSQLMRKYMHEIDMESSWKDSSINKGKILQFIAIDYAPSTIIYQANPK